MATKTGIINQTLVSLGCDPIDSLEEGTAQSRAAAAIWDGCRDFVLRAHPWNFAVKRAQLPRLAAAPAFGYASAFNLPTDCLRVIEPSDTDYVIEAGQILCGSSGPLQIRYISRVEDLSRWDAMAANALAAYLGTKLAYPLTQSTSQQAAQVEIYRRELQEARSVDAQEQPAEEFEESVLVTGRY